MGHTRAVRRNCPGDVKSTDRQPTAALGPSPSRALLQLQRQAGNAAVARAITVQRSAVESEVDMQPEFDRAVAWERLQWAWDLIQMALRGSPDEVEDTMQFKLQRAATATGLIDNAAGQPLAAPVPGLNATLNWANPRAVSNTSTAMDSQDLSLQPMGAGVGATRPNDWWTFVAMVGGNHIFVQGHTLHQELGGDGGHDNLSPFTHSSNALHYHRVETEVIDYSETQDQYVNYDVDLTYGGNPGIGAWAQAKFLALTVQVASAAMVLAGLLTPAQAAARVAAGALQPGDVVNAVTWLRNYVDDTFPSDFDCFASFNDDTAGTKTNFQHVNITNDI